MEIGNQVLALLLWSGGTVGWGRGELSFPRLHVAPPTSRSGPARPTLPLSHMNSVICPPAPLLKGRKPSLWCHHSPLEQLSDLNWQGHSPPSHDPFTDSAVILPPEIYLCGQRIQIPNCPTLDSPRCRLWVKDFSASRFLGSDPRKYQKGNGEVR